MAAVHYKKDQRLLDIHVYRNIVVDMVPAISPRRRHMAAFKIQRYWRRAIADPKFAICRKMQIQQFTNVV